MIAVSLNYRKLYDIITNSLIYLLYGLKCEKACLVMLSAILVYINRLFDVKLLVKEKILT